MQAGVAAKLPQVRQVNPHSAGAVEFVHSAADLHQRMAAGRQNQNRMRRNFPALFQPLQMLRQFYHHQRLAGPGRHPKPHPVGRPPIRNGAVFGGKPPLQNAENRIRLRPSAVGEFGRVEFAQVAAVVFSGRKRACGRLWPPRFRRTPSPRRLHNTATAPAWPESGRSADSQTAPSPAKSARSPRLARTPAGRRMGGILRQC